jgi:hypothetical protein
MVEEVSAAEGLVAARAAAKAAVRAGEKVEVREVGARVAVMEAVKVEVREVGARVEGPVQSQSSRPPDGGTLHAVSRRAMSLHRCQVPWQSTHEAWTCS